MHSHYGFHREIAQDRQSQLLRDAGVEGRAARHLAEIVANQRAETAAERPRARRLNPGGMLMLAQALFRGSARVRPGLSGV